MYIKNEISFRTANLAFQIVGLYKELRLSGALTPARSSDDPIGYVLK